MRTFRWIAAIALPILAVTPCLAPNYTVTRTERFDGPIGATVWRVGATDEIVSSGGNPDSYLQVPPFEGGAPQITVVPSLAGALWSGHLANGTTSIGIDVNLFSLDITNANRPVSLILYRDIAHANEPPGECWAVNVASKGIPHEGSGWRSYDFKVPAWSEHLPGSWEIMGPCANLSSDEAWVRLMGSSLPTFMLGEPGKIYDDQIWDIGFDNARITIGKFGMGPTFGFDADLD